jgi:Pterin 4 alpha carbinolamine dehydratase
MQHHPEIAFNYRTVKIQTQTHRIVNPSVLVPDADGKIVRTPPGITLNDARLAIRIEKLFTDVYLPSGRGRPTGESTNVLKTPETLEEMKILADRQKNSRKDETKRLAENDHFDTE